MVNKCFTADFS